MARKRQHVPVGYQYTQLLSQIQLCKAIAGNYVEAALVGDYDPRFIELAQRFYDVATEYVYRIVALGEQVQDDTEE